VPEPESPTSLERTTPVRVAVLAVDEMLDEIKRSERDTGKRSPRPGKRFRRPGKPAILLPVLMPRHAKVRLVPLRNTLVNLPLSLYGPLIDREVVRDRLLRRRSPSLIDVIGSAQLPQGLVVELSWKNARTSKPEHAFVGWTGLLAQSTWQDKAQNTIEIDPQTAKDLGLKEGVQVS
jgi:hypothetical protein